MNLNLVRTAESRAATRPNIAVKSEYAQDAIQEIRGQSQCVCVGVVKALRK
jgi:hypothetical protein